jgi:hypothetical protein
VTIVDLSAGPPPAAPYGSPDHDPVADLWSRLRRPFEPAAVLAAMAGLSMAEAATVVAAAVAGSTEADRLLDELPRTIRSLATSTTIHHERCRGGLRGPVLWSETMSARASSFGDQDLYVCMTPARAYDVDENRVLVAALVAVRDAADLVTEHTPPEDRGSPAYRRLRRNGHDAGRFVEHPSLQAVGRELPRGRALKRTRAGKKRRQYEPALDLLHRAANPLGLADVRSRGDERTATQLMLLTGLLAGLERAGVRLPAVRAVDDRLQVGALTFHTRRAGDRRRRSGVTAGPVLIDVADVLGEPDRRRSEAALRARAGGRETILVTDEADLERAVARLAPPR